MYIGLTLEIYKISMNKFHSFHRVNNCDKKSGSSYIENSTIHSKKKTKHFFKENFHKLSFFFTKKNVKTEICGFR